MQFFQQRIQNRSVNAKISSGNGEKRKEKAVEMLTVMDYYGNPFFFFFSAPAPSLRKGEAMLSLVSRDGKTEQNKSLPSQPHQR